MSVYRHTVRFVLLGVMLAFVLGASPAFAAVVLTDNYVPPPDATGDGWLLNTGAPQLAQSFTASVGGTLDSATFWMSKFLFGTPTGPVYAELYAITGTYGVDCVPVGAALGVSTPVDAATISAAYPAYVPMTFAFDNTYTLGAGTQYAIALRYEGTDTGDAVLVMDASDPSALGHSGNNSGAWNGYWESGQSIGWPDTDNYFEVYVNELAPAVVSTPASSPWSLALIAGLGLVALPAIRRARAAN